MLIKVCGMKDPENIRELLKSDIDLTGFIFYKGSKRYVDDIPINISERIKKVGVFVNEPIDKLLLTAEENKLDYIQLHGDEAIDDCKKIKEKGFKVIKAFRIYEDFDFEQTYKFEDYCDLFLFDTKGISFGGTGMKFNWLLLNAYKGNTQFLLSGGIGPGDIQLIKNFKHQAFVGIDLNSGFELKAGLKDVLKINTFIKGIRN